MTAPQSPLASILYTIGHSNHELPAFLALLKQHGITAVADVRSQPYSEYSSHFNREPLESALKGEGIRYVFLGEELGARRSEPECYVNGKARYDLVARLPAFRRGLDRLRSGTAAHRIAVMCTEKDPITCHRTILICRQLRSEPFALRHILEDGRLETQEEAEARLMALLGIYPKQLFDTRAELVEHAYDLQGEKIAFTVGSDESGILASERP